MVGREELGAMRERLDAVDVTEGPAQRERREEGENGGAEETGSQGGEVYAPGPNDYFTERIPR